MPERYRGRGFFQYNVEILLMRTNAEEFATLGNMIGERLAAARGPYIVLIPNGFSALTTRRMHDISGKDIGAVGAARNGRGVRRHAAPAHPKRKHPRIAASHQ